MESWDFPESDEGKEGGLVESLDSDSSSASFSSAREQKAMLSGASNVVVLEDGTKIIGETFNHIIRRIGVDGDSHILAGKCIISL